MKTYLHPDIGAFLLRAALGIIFAAHGAFKVLVLSLPQTAEFFAAHGFPGWTAYPVFLIEVVGGAMLLLGLASRWVALALIPVSAGAFLVHWPNGWYFGAPNGGWEYLAFLAVALLVQVTLGNGAWSLESALRRKTAEKAVASPAASVRA